MSQSLDDLEYQYYFGLIGLTPFGGRVPSLADLKLQFFGNPSLYSSPAKLFSTVGPTGAGAVAKAGFLTVFNIAVPANTFPLNSVVRITSRLDVVLAQNATAPAPLTQALVQYNVDLLAIAGISKELQSAAFTAASAFEHKFFNVTDYFVWNVPAGAARTVTGYVYFDCTDANQTCFVTNATPGATLANAGTNGTIPQMTLERVA